MGHAHVCTCEGAPGVGRELSDPGEAGVGPRTGAAGAGRAEFAAEFPGGEGQFGGPGGVRAGQPDPIMVWMVETSAGME